jgi:hypothetical protein
VSNIFDRLFITAKIACSWLRPVLFWFLCGRDRTVTLNETFSLSYLLSEQESDQTLVCCIAGKGVHVFSRRVCKLFELYVFYMYLCRVERQPQIFSLPSALFHKKPDPPSHWLYNFLKNSIYSITAPERDRLSAVQLL